MGTDVHGLAAERLQGGRKRYTRRRQELVELLLAARGPLTVEHILPLGPQLRLSSVYRNLTVLEAADVVRRLSRDPAGHACFELSEDFAGHRHHLACKRCGAMTDVELTDAIEEHLERELDRLAPNAALKSRRTGSTSSEDASPARASRLRCRLKSRRLAERV